MADRKDCYGTMFPDLGRLDLNRPPADKAFEVFVESYGIGASSRQVKLKRQDWQECTSSGSHPECCDLSMAKPALATVPETKS